MDKYQEIIRKIIAEELQKIKKSRKPEAKKLDVQDNNEEEEISDEELEKLINGFEKETYICGNCRYTSEAPFKYCPQCGERNEW